MTALPDAEIRAIGFSWSKGLSDIPGPGLQSAFDRALRDYTNPAVPFGTAQILQAWQGMLDERRRQPKRPVITQDEPCPYCNNTGYQTLYTTGKRLVPMTINGKKEDYEFEGPHTSVRPCACFYAPDGQRSDFPMREPNWKQDKRRGRWERIEVAK